MAVSAEAWEAASVPTAPTEWVDLEAESEAASAAVSEEMADVKE